MEKILWVCKESFTSLTHYCLPHFSDFENEVVFIHPTESLLRDKTYTNFCDSNPNIKIYNLNNISREYSNSAAKSKKIKIDSHKLNYFEEKYCKKMDWGVLLMSSQIFTTPYHYRFYFKDISDEKKNLWILLLFEYFEKLLEETKPNFILDFDNSEIGRTVLWLIADFHNIPYITLEHTRYNGVLIPNFCLGRKVDNYIKEAFLSSCGKTIREIGKVKDFRNQIEIAVKDYNYNKTLKKKNSTLLKDLKRFLFYQKSALEKFFLRCRTVKLRFTFPFIAAYPQTAIFFFLVLMRERFLLSNFNPYFKDVGQEKYIYFPLHLIPESSTLVKAPFYPNEEDVIAAISKSLPRNWKLYLKEHGAMIGERPLSFYKKITRLSNVEFIKLNAFNDPKEWIMNAEGVITITGTSAFEAVMLGKPAIILGTVPFEMIEGIKMCKSLLDLPVLIRNNFQNSVPLDNIESCSKYINVIEQFGLSIEFTFVHNKCYHALLERKTLNKKESTQLEKLSSVFRIGIDLSRKNLITSKDGIIHSC